MPIDEASVNTEVTIFYFLKKETLGSLLVLVIYYFYFSSFLVVIYCNFMSNANITS
jgi:hypothetical protein